MRNIFYVYRTARHNHFKKIKRDVEPDHILYGFNHLDNLSYQVSFSDIAYNPYNILRWILLPLQYYLIKITSVGFKLDQALLLLPKFINCDVIISNADSAGLPILLLKKLRLVKAPIIYISTGLINELEQRRNTLIFKLYEQLLLKADRIVCHSLIEKKLFVTLIPTIKAKVYYVPFGIDSKYFECHKKYNNFILSVGRDKSRDYKFLSRVARKFAHENFLIVTSKSNVQGVDFPPNVTLSYDLPYGKIRKLYCSAKLIFLPLKELRRASGQISLMESIVSGNKVVISKINGLHKSFINYLKSGRLFTFTPQNFESAVKALDKALRSKGNSKGVQMRYTSKSYAQQLDKIIKKI